MRLARLALAVLPLFAFACGSSGSDGLSELPQDFSSSTNGGASSSHKDAGAGGSGSASGDGDGTSLINGSGSGSSSDGDAGTGATTTMACNGLSVKATLPPLKLVVMLDRSGSMGGSNLSSKWTPVTKALETFLDDSSSTGMSASLQFFPASSGDCSVSSYSSMAVDFTSLPDSASAFTTAIAKITPAGDTPTDQALTGALTYASSQHAADTSGAIYAAVLVTDGDPNGCNAPAGEAGAKQVGTVAAGYATAADPILTYVIGVGQDSTYLNDIAEGGGTATATMVSTTTTPAQTSTDLIAALNKIRTASIGCSYPIPAAPTGQTYDANAVNVNYTVSGGASQTLPYDPTCTGSGWHYDSETAPTEIILCGQSCNEVKSGTGGSVDVVFGCATAGGIPGYDGGVSIR